MTHCRTVCPLHYYDLPSGPPSTPPPSTITLADDMEWAPVWTGSGTGADWSVALDEVHAHSPTHELTLRTRVTGPTTGDYVDAGRTLAVPPLHLVSHTAWVMIPSLASLHTLWITTRWNLGAHLYAAEVLYHHPTAKWYYLDEVGTYVEIPAWAGPLAALTWYPVTLRCDLDAHCYRTAQLGASLVNLDAIPVIDLGAGVAAYLKPLYIVTTATDAPAAAAIDDVLIDTAPP